MPEPTGSDLHIDTLLSNMSVGYLNAPSAYIADRVFPVIRSTKQSDKFAKYNKYDWFRDEAKERAPLTESVGGGYAMLDPGTFFCNEYAFHQDLDDGDIANADPVFRLEQDAVQFVIEKLRISRERRWASNYFGTGIWGTDLDGQTSSPGSDEFLCWDETDSTPIEDVEDAKTVVKTNTGITPNTLVVSERVHQVLKQHENIIDRFKYTQTGIITEQLLAMVFEVDYYYVARAVYASSPEGSESMSYVMNQKDALLVYSAPAPSRFRPSGGYTFRWTRPRIGGQSGEKLESTIRKFRLPKEKGLRIEGSVYENLNLVASDVGIYFHNAISLGSTIT